MKKICLFLIIAAVISLISWYGYNTYYYSNDNITARNIKHLTQKCPEEKISFLQEVLFFINDKKSIEENFKYRLSVIHSAFAKCETDEDCTAIRGYDCTSNPCGTHAVNKNNKCSYAFALETHLPVAFFVCGPFGKCIKQPKVQCINNLCEITESGVVEK